MHFSLEKTTTAKNAYNVKTNKAYGWLTTIPWDVFGIDTSDGIDRQELLNLQEAIGVDADGLIGLSTLRSLQLALKSEYGTLWNPLTGTTTKVDEAFEVNSVIWKGLEIPMPQIKSARVHTHLDPRGVNLHATGSFNKKDREITAAIVHWGGLNPQHLGRVFENRKASSHFGVGICEVTGEPSIFQYLDTAHIAWHAKGANEQTIGIDICQQPELKHLGYYKRHNYDVQTIENPSAPLYGPAKIISLDPRIQASVVELLQGLCEGFRINRYAPLTREGVVGKDFDTYGGLYSHFHVDFAGQGKWDVAPWWDDIVYDLGFMSYV